MKQTVVDDEIVVVSMLAATKAGSRANATGQGHQEIRRTNKRTERPLRFSSLTWCVKNLTLGLAFFHNASISLLSTATSATSATACIPAPAPVNRGAVAAAVASGFGFGGCVGENESPVPSAVSRATLAPCGSSPASAWFPSSRCSGETLRDISDRFDAGTS